MTDKRLVCTKLRKQNFRASDATSKRKGTWAPSAVLWWRSESEDSVAWVDGMVRLRGRYSFTPEIYLTGWVWSAAAGVDIDWNAALRIVYEFNERDLAIAGYSALGLDYIDDGFPMPCRKDRVSGSQ